MSLPDYTLRVEEIPDYTPSVLSPETRDQLILEIRELLRQKNAVIVAHYYVDAEIQKLAESSGGIVADSLEMARFGSKHSAQMLVVAGVRFMGETAKILSPDKRILMPTLKSECSLDIGCPPAAFETFVKAHPERTVVVYANTSAKVKALSDWVVTSSNALAIIEHLDALGQKILWAPDKYLGAYIQKQSQADMLLWSGACVVHEEFKAKALSDLKKVYPDAAVLVHPESPEAVIALADVVGSTSQIIQGARELRNDTFIVATDRGIFHKLRSVAPDKHFIEAPTAGDGATCRSCAHCPWMAMNELQALRDSLKSESNEIRVDEAVRIKAMIPLQRMLDFQV